MGEDTETLNKRILNLQCSYETQGKTADSMFAQYGIIARPERDRNSRSQSTAVNWIISSVAKDEKVNYNHINKLGHFSCGTSFAG